MANPQTLIAEAFEKLKRSISEEDAQNFASTELKDVWRAVRDIDSEQRKRQSAQNLRRIEPLLRGIEKYTKVIEVLCNGTPYMPYVWAPIKLMLEIASHYRDVFEALLSAYADIGSALPHFDRYKTTFNDNLEFQYALAAVYSGILDFHQRAYKFFRRRAWNVIFLSLWSDFGSRFESIIGSLKKQRDFVDIEAASFDIIEAKESRKRLQDEIQRNQKREQEMVEEKEENAKTSQLQHSIAWLSLDEKTQEKAYESASRKRYDKTCQWILSEPRWKPWIKDDSRNLCLWLNGIPGSGKSIMCSYINLALTNIPGLTTCYFFCSNQDSGNVCQQVLTIIILQIIRQHLEVRTLIANEYVYRGLTCGMAQLRILVPQILVIIGYTRIVIDGIDECSKENQKTILKELQTVCRVQNSHCKVLFSSRREPHIVEKLSSKPQISLNGRQEVDSDIRSYVKYKVAKLQARTTDRALLDSIETHLVKKADGMFLWVRLVLGELKHCYSDKAMEDTVKSLPKGLKAAYGRILDRILSPSNSRNATYMAIRILRWMCYSYKKPLKVFELLDGLAFDFYNTSISAKTKIRNDILNLLSAAHRGQLFRHRGFCTLLCRRVGSSLNPDIFETDLSRFILKEEYQDGRPFIWRENAHLDIAFSCTAMLNSCIPLVPTNSTDIERAAIIVQGFHGLQVYANKFWYRHVLAYCGFVAQNQGQISPELLAQLELLLRLKKADIQSALTSNSRTEEDSSVEPGLKALSHVPLIKSLLSDVLQFQARMSRKESSDKSPEKVSAEACALDPLHMSTIRHVYHQATESLLDKTATEKFPDIDKKVLESFQSTFGASAFVCRYMHCGFSSAGFGCVLDRDKHESKHERRFRCADHSCVRFKTGFATRGFLNQHNEVYHAVIVKGPSLAESLAPVPPSTSVHPKSFLVNGQKNLSDNGNLDALRDFNFDDSFKEGTDADNFNFDMIERIDGDKISYHSNHNVVQDSGFHSSLNQENDELSKSLNRSYQDTDAATPNSRVYEVLNENGGNEHGFSSLDPLPGFDFDSYLKHDDSMGRFSDVRDSSPKLRKSKNPKK